MPLKALYQFKVNELFLQWISQPETQEFLLMNLQYISRDSVPSPTQRRPYRKFLKKIAEKNRPSPKTKKKKIKKSDRPEETKTVTPTPDTGSRNSPNSNDVPQENLNHKIPDKILSKREGETVPKESAELLNDSLEMEISNLFNGGKHNTMRLKDFHKILQACRLPFYLRKPIFEGMSKKTDCIDFDNFLKFWRRLGPFHQEKEKMVFKILSDGTDYIKEDFLESLVQDVVNTHPKLRHLKMCPDFHEIYRETVIERIFMGVAKTWRKMITFPEAKAANFFRDIENLSTELACYFDYKDFFVIYCTFRELDRDGDNFLEEKDMMFYDDGGFSPMVVAEMFKKKNLMNSASGRMNYSDFVRFIMAEEGKNERISIEYWFRCLDVDGNGILTYPVLREFYLALMDKNEFIVGEKRNFEDVYWQCVDMIRPTSQEGFRLSDLKKSNLAGNFLNTFVNFNKFINQEEMFANEYSDKTPWKAFVESRYNQLAQETMQVNQLSDTSA